MTRRRTAALPTPVALLFLLPAAALFAIFVLYPMATALTYSLFSWRGTAQEAFVGLDNFATLLTTEPYRSQLPRAFAHNGLLFAGAMVVQNSVGLLLAYALHKRERLRRLFQVLYTMPYLVSPLVVGYLWSLLLSPLFGPVNTPRRRERLGQRLTGEVRVAVRPRHGAHVDQPPHAVRLQQPHELLERARRVADRVDGRLRHGVTLAVREAGRGPR